MNLTTPTKPARNTGAQLRNTFGDLLTGPGLKDVLASSRRYEMTLPDSATTAAAPPASWPATAGCAPTASTATRPPSGPPTTPKTAIPTTTCPAGLNCSCAG